MAYEEALNSFGIELLFENLEIIGCTSNYIIFQCNVNNTDDNLHRVMHTLLCDLR